MAFTMKEFLAQDLSPSDPSIGNCGVCDKPITDEHPDEVRMIDKKPVHEDCYFNDLSNLLEQHPIGTPRVRR